MTTLIFNLQKAISKLIFAGCTGSKNPFEYRLKNPVCQTGFFPLRILKIKFDNQQKAISKLVFAGYTGSKNPVRNRLKHSVCQTRFFQLRFLKIKYKWIRGELRNLSFLSVSISNLFDRIDYGIPILLKNL